MLKITKFLNRSHTEIQIAFNLELDSNISINNISIKSNVLNVSNLTIRSLDISNRVLTLQTSPQLANQIYFVEVFSTTSQDFKSVDGQKIQEDGQYNKVYFTGLEYENTVRDSMLTDLSPIYDVDRNTFVRNYISGISDQLLKARTDIRETGNANYLIDTVTNEIKTRGFGPSDRLFNESTYKVKRVSLNPEGQQFYGLIEYNISKSTNLLGVNYQKANSNINTFSDQIRNLKSKAITEVVSNSERVENKFDGLTITLSKQNIVTINSVVLVKDNVTYIYDIPTYKYALLDNSYDLNFSYSLATLENNQVKLSDRSVLDLDFAVPSGSDVISINYTYIDNGIDIDSDSIVVYDIRQSVRESVGGFLNVFSLTNHPVVNILDKIPSSGGVEFLDPSPDVGNPYEETHPAFSLEIPYNTSRLPSLPGEYSVDYATGKVFVYGETTSDGTGSVPPVATYYYRKIFHPTIDYNIDYDNDEIVVVPGRELADAEAKVSFYYDQVLAEGIDFINEAHVEVIDEYVENRLLNQSTLITKFRPITDVFNVYNETTGETYRTTRFSDNFIYFSGRQLPRISKQLNEIPLFDTVMSEALIISDELVVDGLYKIVSIQLENNNITSTLGYFTGSNLNSSLYFSNSELFVREFFFDNVFQTVAQNIAKLSVIGDYLVDYLNGVIYVMTDPDQDFTMGEATYSHAYLKTNFENIYSINSIQYKYNNNGSTLLDVDFESSTYSTIQLTNLKPSVERFINEDPTNLILLGLIQFGKIGQYSFNSDRFIAFDANFSEDFDDGYHTLRIPGVGDKLIVSVISKTEVQVDTPFENQNRGVAWAIIDGNPGYPISDGYKTLTTFDISSITGVYTITDLQTLDKASLTNYYDSSVDQINGNQIIFSNNLISTLSPGTALAIEYNFGSIYIDYEYIQDNLRVSYEYGDNSINFSVNDSIETNQEYFVSYEYGALRESLLTNFGALTQLEELITLPLSFERELYRGFLLGTLQGFVAGPTVSSIKALVKAVTQIDPEIKELSFNEWTLGRDNLYLAKPTTTGELEYQSCKFNNGLVVNEDITVAFPAESYISYKEGTFESYIKPFWNGVDNDSTLTFTIYQDGYLASNIYNGLINNSIIKLNEIWIGSIGFNPITNPFDLNRYNEYPESPVGRPTNFGQKPGCYIWYDDTNNVWNVVGVADPVYHKSFNGTITTSGTFNNVNYDGYVDNSDLLRSTNSNIDFTFTFDGYEVADGYDGYTYFEYLDSDGYVVTDGYLFSDVISFVSDDKHYIFDTGPSLSHNRMSLYKNSNGFLNFDVIDNTGKLKAGKAKKYSVSSDISDWVSNEVYHVACSWRLNSSEGIDELHLFKNGQEVSNILRFGGTPEAESLDLYKSIAEEELSASLLKTTISGTDGVSTAASSTFTSASSTFVSSGIITGDTLTILDNTVDGLGSPYTILSVIDNNTITLSASLTLSLNAVNFSINQTSFISVTDIDTETIAAYIIDGYGERTELNGLDASNPDYYVTRNAGINTIVFTNGLIESYSLVLNTLGLTHGRCRDVVYKYDGYYGHSDYDGYNFLESRGSPPSSLEHLDVYKILFLRTNIANLSESLSADGYFSVTGVAATSSFTGLCNPSNMINGKKLALNLGGIDNIDFGGTNEVVLNGTTFAGPASETITWVSYGIEETTNFFTSISSIDMEFTCIDPTESFGSIEIAESIPLTIIENNGAYAQPISYNNGMISFMIYGSGGDLFYIEPGCYYRFDYPTKLNIPMDSKGTLYIGSDISGASQFDGVLEQIIFLNEKLDDIRVGEDKATTRTVTQDFNNPLPAKVNSQTLMLLPLNNNLDNVDRYFKIYNENYLSTSLSVNTSFNDAAVFYNKAFSIDNGSVVFNNNEGSIEFWVSPLIDTAYDESFTRHFVDVTSLKEEILLSTTKTTITLTNKARKIVSVKLVSDDTIDYFDSSGSLAINGKTITLKNKLPSQQVMVSVVYTPIDFSGDRVSIYKDGYNNLNFEILANDIVYQINYPILWNRNSWHRVMATWKCNTINSNDKMRLFVDGLENGTVTYGTPGLKYGVGIIYGVANVNNIDSRLLTANIDLLDTFGEIRIGNNFTDTSPAYSKIDNLRFSNAVRQPSIIAGESIDLNYNSNLEAVSPVIDDGLTTGLYDFDQSLDQSEFLTNLLSKYTPLYLFDVIIDDSFNKIKDNQLAKDLLIKIIKRMKPAHSNVFIKFLED